MGNEFKNYRKKVTATVAMRPYEQGEDMTGITVSDLDVPNAGGMIVVNPNDSDDKWYISEKYFEENYELVE